jgi:hypothetical protein
MEEPNGVRREDGKGRRERDCRLVVFGIDSEKKYNTGARRRG